MVVGYIAPPPGRNTANDALYAKLDAEVDVEMFTMLANHSSWAGELSQYALAMTRIGGISSLERLRGIPEEAVERMGQEVGMQPDHIRRLIESRNKVDPRFAEQIAKDKARQESSAVFRLMKVFDSIDTDHSGVISRAELAQKLKKDDALERVLRMKTDLTPRTLESAHGQTQIDMLLDVMDQRGDGSISWQDFVEGVAQVEAQRIFDGIDRNHTGSVSRDEFHRKLQLDDELETLLNFHGVQGTTRSFEAFGGTRTEHFNYTQDMEALLKSVDRDGDGEITWDEFWTAVRFKSGIFKSNNAAITVNFSAAMVPQTA
jgi:Ca2+-binding EF-hand superfamily protein